MKNSDDKKRQTDWSKSICHSLNSVYPDNNITCIVSNDFFIIRVDGDIVSEHLDPVLIPLYNVFSSVIINDFKFNLSKYKKKQLTKFLG